MYLALCLLAVFLPNGPKRWVYRHLLGWKVSPTASIGFSFIHAQDVTLGDRVRIGHFNVMKELGSVHIGPDVYIKNFNSVFAQRMPVFPDRSFSVGRGAKIMSRHFFDVSGSIHIGEESIIGGRDSQFWSHSQFTEKDGSKALRARKLVLGRGVYTGARVLLVHCTVADDCVIGAGAVVTGSFMRPGSLIIGNPAVARER